MFASKMLQLREQITARGEDPYAKDPAHIAAVVLYAAELTGHLFAFCPWLDFLMWAAVGIPAYTHQYVTENDNKTTLDGVAEAMSILTQQMTTIGYGSTTAHENSTVSMAVHSLGSLIAQLGLGSWWKDFVNLIFDASKCRRPILCSFIEFTLAFATNVLMFAYDCPWGGECLPFPSAMEWMKGVYTTVISMTTVGYGDVAPDHYLHKFASFVTQPWLGSSFDELVATYPVWLFNHDNKEFLKRKSLFEYASSAVEPAESKNEEQDVQDEEVYSRSFGDDVRYLASPAVAKVKKWLLPILPPARQAAPVEAPEVKDSDSGSGPHSAQAPDSHPQTVGLQPPHTNAETDTGSTGSIWNRFRRPRATVAQAKADKKIVTVHRPFLSFDFKQLRVCKHIWTRKKTPDSADTTSDRVDDDEPPAIVSVG